MPDIRANFFNPDGTPIKAVPALALLMREYRTTVKGTGNAPIFSTGRNRPITASEIRTIIRHRMVQARSAAFLKTTDKPPTAPQCTEPTS